MENESSIKEIIRNSLEQVRTVIDADTIVGKQIVTPSGVVIIPISKVSMGFASGGLDLPNGYEDGKKNFGGGGGTGVTVSPVGFLTVSPNGAVELIPMTPDKTTPIEQIAEIINNAPAVIGRIKNVFVKGDAEESTSTDAEAVNNVSNDLEEAYRKKLAQEVTDDTERIADEAEKILEDQELPLSKEEQKRLKKEAKERRKLDKKQAGTLKEVHSPEDDPVQKRGKLSEKTLEKGMIK